MSEVNLSKAVRSNLLSLQSTAAQMGKTQQRLATGLKVNSALDNPTNFFTASSLNSRAGDMASLLDSMGNGIKTIEAADNGLSSIVKTVETMQSTLRQARQDKSFKGSSFVLDAATIGTSTIKSISFSGGSVGSSPVSVNLNDTSAATAGVATLTFGGSAVAVDAGDSFSFTATVDGSAQSITIDNAAVTAVGNNDGVIDDADEYRAILQAKISGVTVSGTGNTITLTSATTGASSDVNLSLATITDTDSSSTGLTAAAVGLSAAINGTAGAAAGASAGTPKGVDQLVTEINSNPALRDKIRASNDGNKVRIENLSTSDLSVTGVGSDGEIDGSVGTPSTIGRNDVRKNLAQQFNELRDQLDKFADDASFNGINLLRGDKLKLTFNESGSSTIEIQAKTTAGVPTAINNAALDIDHVDPADLDTDSTIDGKLGSLAEALGFLRSLASSFGSNLSIVENRTDFTKKMINTLETGGANLTLADTNEEAANLLALQTRQQLSSTALSMASQADQAVLRLFS